ncbi:MAG: ATP-dependent Clp protease adaptor ClpS [Ginsengibacter sp.]|jgi:ATP-dependent Clp protease adaptor protein ClpS
MNATEPYKAESEEADLLVADGNRYQLVVWNDEVNTFQWVIETLVEVCGHTPEQAEQSAMIIHTKGKYAVKEGAYNVLKPMRDTIVERGINATVEELSEK